MVHHSGMRDEIKLIKFIIVAINNSVTTRSRDDDAKRPHRFCYTAGDTKQFLIHNAYSKLLTTLYLIMATLYVLYLEKNNSLFL